MQVKLIQDALGPNPHFDAAEAIRARKEGRPYAIKPDRVIPAGTILSGPECWLHCVNGLLNAPPIAVPADDEARAMYRKWLDGRSDAIRSLAQTLLHGKPRTAEETAWYEQLREAYREELAALDPLAFPLATAGESKKTK